MVNRRFKEWETPELNNGGNGAKWGKGGGSRSKTGREKETFPVNRGETGRPPSGKGKCRANNEKHLHGAGVLSKRRINEREKRDCRRQLGEEYER